MKIERLTLRNYRNVTEAVLEADSRLNFIVGKNGQGKTSFLEAIGYLALLRSFRGAKTEEVAHWGLPYGEVSGIVSPDGDEGSSAFRTELRVQFERGEGRSKKTASINGKSYTSSTQYLSQRFGHFHLGFHAVVFSPNDHDLVRGDPAERRAFLDRVLSAEDPEYLQATSKYARVLEQRNRLLKDAEGAPPRDLWLGFTEPLVTLGSRIALKRLEWIRKAEKPLARIALNIAPSQPKLSLFLHSTWIPKITGLSFSNKDLDIPGFSGQDPLPTLEILEQSFWKQLSLMREVELRSRSSCVGPHRDDWAFFFGEQPLKGFGSQGEVRSALLSLKLSEIELFRERTNHRPVLLLDDFSSELDRDRREFLLRFLLDSDLQVFVTTTEDSLGLGRRFVVSSGAIHRMDQRVENDIEFSERADPLL